MRFLRRHWPVWLPEHLIAPLVILGVAGVLVSLPVLFGWPFKLALRRAMLWNLFLSAVPLLLSVFILWAEHRRIKVIFRLPAWLLWLFFFPNGPYMITDILHVQYLNVDFMESSPAVWFGVLHLCAGVAAGTCLGLLSLRLLHRHMAGRYGKPWGWVFVGGACLLGGIAIWIGRCMRFNSWDIWGDPHFLLRSVLAELNRNTVTLCLLFAVMCFGAYLLLWGFVGTTTPQRRGGCAEHRLRADYNSRR